MKKLLIVTLLFSFLTAFQCESDDPAPFDNLESTGLLGRWEIEDEVINGVISDLLPKCCEFLEFYPDSNIEDYKGLWTYTDAHSTNSGTFEVDVAIQTVFLIDDDNDEFSFEFSVNDSQEILTIDFIENGVPITQDWVRVD